MALSIVKVQDTRVLLGPLLQQESFLLVPGTGDYPTGGYVLSATALSFGKLQSAWVSGANATAIATWNVQPLFALAQVGSGGPGFSGYSQILFYAYVLATGAQVANNGNLTGAIWELTVQGY